jgi:hypothetical protein
MNTASYEQFATGYYLDQFFGNRFVLHGFLFRELLVDRFTLRGKKCPQLVGRNISSSAQAQAAVTLDSQPRPSAPAAHFDGNVHVVQHKVGGHARLAWGVRLLISARLALASSMSLSARAARSSNGKRSSRLSSV